MPDITKYFRPGRLIVISLSGLLGALAAALTLLFKYQTDETFFGLFYPLFPGLMVSLFITGAHGGTATEETVGPIVGAIVNAFCYAAIPVVPWLIWHSLKTLPAAECNKR